MATLSNMTGDPVSRTVEFLTPIWRRLLEQKIVRPDENFFDLGGNPDVAQALFAEIKRESGRELCPLLIYQAPTVSKLAALLDAPEPATLAPLLRMNNGVNGSPVFVGHGIGGTVDGLFHFVQRMRTSRPIYGMQARGIDGMQAPHDRIEDIAQYHVDAIRQVQSRGPYFIVGYSLAGVIAIEIAQRLAKGGEEIGLLVMLDSYPDIRYLKLRPRARLNWQRAKRRVLSLTAKGNPQRAGSSMVPWLSAALERVATAQRHALQTYKPSFYDGKVVFIKASEISHFPDDPVSVWAPLVRDFECHSLPCDHLSMLTTHADELASIVQRCVQSASTPVLATTREQSRNQI